ncbi:MAG: hypothetical protein FRX49_04587 [Trebouxia sp. A1-2]|nr:MAG: hypothetical protein FRX49_04587 [Trebouxia sp. A1-2]
MPHPAQSLEQAQNIAMSGVNELSIDDIRQVTHQQDPPCLPDPQDQLVLPYLHHQAYHQKVYVAGYILPQGDAMVAAALTGLGARQQQPNQLKPLDLQNAHPQDRLASLTSMKQGWTVNWHSCTTKQSSKRILLAVALSSGSVHEGLLEILIHAPQSIEALWV